jgi:hypothetical protein
MRIQISLPAWCNRSVDIYLFIVDISKNTNNFILVLDEIALRYILLNNYDSKTFVCFGKIFSELIYNVTFPPRR